MLLVEKIVLINTNMNPFKAFDNILKVYVNDKTITELPNRWQEKHRFYHGTNHLIEILQDIEKDIWFKELSLNEKHALLLAAFFHDAVYDPKKKDNEDKSILLFTRSYKGKDQKMFDTVCDLIEVTKYRKRPVDKLKRIFWNADNAGFKKGYDVLLKNEKLIQKEFSFVPKKEYKQKRIDFLKSNIGLFGTFADKDLKKLIQYVEKNL